MKLSPFRIAIGIYLLMLCIACNHHNSDVAVDIQDLYHHSVGLGKPIIVIHGGPGFGCAYIEPHLSDLSRSNQVIYYDQRNSGRSPINHDSSRISLQGFLDDIESIRKFYGHQQVALLAHSWGGLLGMNYAIQHPDKVSHLILMNSNAPVKEINDQANTRMANQMSADDIEARTMIMRTEAFNNQNPKAYEELMSIGFSYQFADRNLVDELQLKLPDDFGKKSQEMSYLYQDFSNYNYSEKLKNIKVPTLLLYGLKDPLTPFALNSLSQILPNNTIKAIDDAGHFPFIEKTDETIIAIKQFVN